MDTPATRFLSSTSHDDAVRTILDVDPPKRTLQDWQALGEYFLGLDAESSPSISSELLVEWYSVILFCARQNTVQGVLESMTLMHRLALHLIWYPEEDAAINEFRATKAKTALTTVLQHWKTLLSSNMPLSGSKLFDAKDMIDEGQLPSVSRMLKWVKECRRMRIPVTTTTYNSLIIQAAINSAKTFQQKMDLPLVCEEAMADMLSDTDMLGGPAVPMDDMNSSRQMEQIVRPDTYTFHLLLRTWAKSQRNDIVQRTLRLLGTMNDLSEKGVINCRPNTKMYNSILEIFCSRKTIQDVQKAERIFYDMDQGLINEDVYPDFVSYRIMFFAFCNILEQDSSDEACQRAINFLHEIELAENQHRILRTAMEHGGRPRLDSSMYAYLIMTLARLEQVSLAEQVHAMLQNMQTEFQEARFLPNTHVKRALLQLNVARMNPQEAEELLVEMERDAQQNPRENEAPKINHYEAVVESLLLSEDNNGGRKAAAWIVHLIGLAKSGHQSLIPSTRVINLVLERLADRRQQEKERNQHKTSRDAPLDTEKLLRIISEAERSLGLPYPLLDQDSYKRAIHSWIMRSRDLDAPQRAERLLLEMQRRSEKGQTFLTPGAAHYTGVITVWCRSGQKGWLNHAKEIFDEAYERYMSGIRVATPDTIMYGSMISACARIGDMDGLEYYSNLLIHDYRRGNHSATPSTDLLNSALFGFVRGQHPPSKSAQLFNVVEQLKPFVDFDQRTTRLLREIKAHRAYQQY